MYHVKGVHELITASYGKAELWCTCMYHNIVKGAHELTSVSYVS